ncbi:hypothetical protein CAPTEDRAFT_173301 [Capitella teleta]|uniref:Transmembrane protein 246 n=1 Tax=Capitella teleta TaxID=283909 RepID=R7TWQ4_CAPTE|nr:hypothetical protein CAPTEDRAFT_173301 [Capitella teleta]|eukprot:ELT98042.1 hypothetical protein CAPTEDRAFT_173301 [Capitella teleta]
MFLLLQIRRWKWRFLSLFCSNLWTFYISLYVVTFLIGLPILCNDWAYSSYLAKHYWTLPHLSLKAINENEERSASARSYFTSVENKSAYKSHAQGDVDLAIAVITIRRSNGPKPLYYLSQVMAALHRASEKEQRLFQNKRMFICNVYAGPGSHIEAEALSEFFEVRSRFPNGSISATIMDRFAKEKEDYMYCMQQALTSNPKHVMMIEDDAAPHPHLFPVLNQLLLNPKLQSNPYAFVKLYYPERWQGFSYDVHRLIELLGVSLIGGSISVFVTQLLFARNYSERNAFFLGALYLMMLTYTIGRPYLLELRRVSPSMYTLNAAADCCSPSILYPREITSALLHFLNGTTCKPDFAIDLALDAFVHDRDLLRFSLEPNLFKHIGFMSTIKGMSHHPEEFLYL